MPVGSLLPSDPNGVECGISEDMITQSIDRYHEKGAFFAVRSVPFHAFGARLVRWRTRCQGVLGFD